MTVLPLKQIQRPKRQIRIDKVNECLRIFSVQLTTTLTTHPETGIRQIILYRSGVDPSSVCVISVMPTDNSRSVIDSLESLVLHTLTVGNVSMMELLRVHIGSGEPAQESYEFCLLNDPDEDWSMVCIIQMNADRSTTYIPVDREVSTKFLTISL